MNPDRIVIGDLFQCRRGHDTGALFQTVIKAVFKYKPVQQYGNLQNPVGHKANVIKPVHQSVPSACLIDMVYNS